MSATALGSRHRARRPALQMGALLAFLGARVLGQYDPFGGPDRAGRLLLVAPNVVAAREALDVDARGLRPVGVPARGHPPAAVHRRAVAARPLPLRGRQPSRSGFDRTAPGAVDRLPEILRAMRTQPAARRARDRRDVAGPRAARRPRPAARPDHPAGGPRRARHGRRRPGGRAQRRHDPRALHHPAPGRRAPRPASCARCWASTRRSASTSRAGCSSTRSSTPSGSTGLNAVWTSPETLPAARGDHRARAPGSPASTADASARCASPSRSPPSAARCARPSL